MGIVNDVPYIQRFHLAVSALTITAAITELENEEIRDDIRGEQVCIAPNQDSLKMLESHFDYNAI